MIWPNYDDKLHKHLDMQEIVDTPAQKAAAAAKDTQALNGRYRNRQSIQFNHDQAETRKARQVLEQARKARQVLELAREAEEMERLSNKLLARVQNI
jgi:urease gamma subunit